MKRSPLAIRMIKRGLNAELDGQAGLMEFAGDATLMYYLMEEAQEGKNAFLEKRTPTSNSTPSSLEGHAPRLYPEPRGCAPCLWPAPVSSRAGHWRLRRALNKRASPAFCRLSFDGRSAAGAGQFCQ